MVDDHHLQGFIGRQIPQGSCREQRKEENKRGIKRHVKRIVVRGKKWVIWEEDHEEDKKKRDVGGGLYRRYIEKMKVMQ